MSFRTRTLLTSPNETCSLAQRLGQKLRPGDVLLLEGDIGTGKTHFARCLIQSLLRIPEDVPSPTFTLVQTYDAADCEIWHADLYRLTSPEEVVELGLTDAFESAICLVEWPDRLAELVPANALTLSFRLCAEEGHREVEARWQSDRWADLLADVLESRVHD